MAGARRVLKEAIHILNEGAPEDADAQEVTQALAEIPEVLRYTMFMSGLLDQDTVS